MINGPLQYVLGHCDLESANVIIPSEVEVETDMRPGMDHLKGKVYFFEYEFAVPCPPVFEIANHFSEWGGTECNYNMLPTRAIRRDFIKEYLQSLSQHKDARPPTMAEIENLHEEVDRYRGIPGFYWGVQSWIQSIFSSVGFDWVGYAELRLQEFWDWRAEQDGERAREGKEKPLREHRWAQME